MSIKISKLDLQKGIKSPITLVKESTLSINNNKSIQLFSNNNKLYCRGIGNFNEVTSVVSEYTGEINVTIYHKEFTECLSLLGSEIALKQLSDGNLALTDGINKVALINSLEDSYGANTGTLEDKLEIVENEGKEYDKNHFLTLIKYLTSVLPKESFVSSGKDIFINGLCAYISDSRYIARFDLESELTFVLTSPMSNILQSLLSVSGDTNFKIHKTRSDILFKVGNNLYEVNSVDNTLRNVDEIINNFERDDYFKIDIKETIKYIKLARLFAGNDSENVVLFRVKNGKGTISSDSDTAKTVSKFDAEFGVESNFSVNSFEILKVLNGMLSQGAETTHIQVDSESDCIFFEFSGGDCYMAIDEID